jgi:endonuclease-3 related protein
MLERPPGKNDIKNLFDRLLAYYGHQHWWPAKTRFEVMTGAVLTQATSWESASKAIANLKASGNLSPQALEKIKEDELGILIRPSGYYNAKALKLKALVKWLKGSCGYDIGRLEDYDTSGLRRELLAVHGIGPETADSILLYALGRPVFVIDAYTRRIIDRLGLSPGRNRNYDSYQRLFAANLAPDPALFNEYHALLVMHGKTFCRAKPQCKNCCVADICYSYKEHEIENG